MRSLHPRPTPPPRPPAACAAQRRRRRHAARRGAVPEARTRRGHGDDDAGARWKMTRWKRAQKRKRGRAAGILHAHAHMHTCTRAQEPQNGNAIRKNTASVKERRSPRAQTGRPAEHIWHQYPSAQLQENLAVGRGPGGGPVPSHKHPWYKHNLMHILTQAEGHPHGKKHGTREINRNAAKK